MEIKIFFMLYLIFGVIYLIGPLYLRRLARRLSKKDINDYLTSLKSK